MATQHEELGLDDFHSMAVEWHRWKDALSRSPAAPPGSSPAVQRVSSLASISQNRGTWELAVTSAAYALLRPPRIIEVRRGTDLSVVAHALTSTRGRELLPDFEGIAASVSGLPMKRLVRSAPRLAAILRGGEVLTAASVACTAYCMSLYPNDGPGFLRCMKEC